MCLSVFVSPSVDRIEAFFLGAIWFLVIGAIVISEIINNPNKCMRVDFDIFGGTYCLNRGPDWVKNIFGEMRKF